MERTPCEDPGKDGQDASEANLANTDLGLLVSCDKFMFFKSPNL